MAEKEPHTKIPDTEIKLEISYQVVQFLFLISVQLPKIKEKV